MRREKALRAAGRAIDSTADQPAGLFQRIADGVRRWWQRRRIERIGRSLARGNTRAADHSSAALLAVLTDRIARLEVAPSPVEVSAAVEIARHVRDEYEAYISRLVAMRDSARAEAGSWRTRITEAEATERADLTEEAQRRLEDWERREREASETLARCEAGRRRIADAMAQLGALAARTASRANAPLPR